MTINQMQHLLAYHGLYLGAVDGLWGPVTEKSVRDFQAAFGLEVDGIVGVATEEALRHSIAYGLPEKDGDTVESWWDEIEFFTREELRCKCGGRYCDGFPAEPDERMVRIADQLRKNLGVPVEIVSGLRCETWNAIQGGEANSQHMYGEAADICARGVTQSRVEAELDKIGGVRYHYPIKNSNNVHFDVPKGIR